MKVKTSESVKSKNPSDSIKKNGKNNGKKNFISRFIVTLWMQSIVAVFNCGVIDDLDKKDSLWRCIVKSVSSELRSAYKGNKNSYEAPTIIK